MIWLTSPGYTRSRQSRAPDVPFTIGSYRERPGEGRFIRVPEEFPKMLSWFSPEWRFYTPVSDGSQLWTDQFWRREYRLQSYALGNSWRVICPRGTRRASGTEDECLAEFNRLAGDLVDDGPPQHIAILLHGLIRTRRCMRKLGHAIEQSGISTVIRFDYASTRQAISSDAAALRRLVEGLPAGATLSFVGHSMGNIVVRRAIGDLQSAGDPRRVLPRMHRVVMLGPPNNGAAIARLLAKLKLFGLVAGEGGLELGPNWQTLLPKLAIPPCPFAIVAGDLSKFRIRNPLVGQAGDLLVSVDEARLDGAAEFIVLPIAHSQLMTDRRVVQFVSQFLNQPIEPALANQSN